MAHIPILDYYEDEYYQPGPEGNGYQPTQQTAEHAQDHTAESEGYAAPEYVERERVGECYCISLRCAIFTAYVFFG